MLEGHDHDIRDMSKLSRSRLAQLSLGACFNFFSMFVATQLRELGDQMGPERATEMSYQ